MDEAVIESGFAKVAKGAWLTGLAQPVACLGQSASRPLRGFFVPDRACVRETTVSADAWCAAAERPFLTRLPALPDEPLRLVSAKLLVAPLAARAGARRVKLVPFGFAHALPVTEFRLGWAIAATRSRLARVPLADGETLTVRPESVVAWIGNDPTGSCPRLGALDLLLPRGPKNLAYAFHGPGTVWVEGAQSPSFAVRRGWAAGRSVA